MGIVLKTIPFQLSPTNQGICVFPNGHEDLPTNNFEQMSIAIRFKKIFFALQNNKFLWFSRHKLTKHRQVCQYDAKVCVAKSNKIYGRQE